MQKGKQRFTVMLIPHSEKKIFNFQISFFTLIFISSVLLIVLVGFFLLATHFTSTNERMTQVSNELNNNQTTLVNLKDQISGFQKVSKDFKAQMDGVLKAINREEYLASGTGGPLLASVPAGTEESDSETLRELSELESMKTLMENSVAPLGEIKKAMSGFKELLANIPTLWPLKGVHGNITTRFGWTTTPPIHMQGYLHTGLDIAWGDGTPIVATANGVVVQETYDDDLGNYVVLKHKYGFSTKYAHMLARAVRKGQRVNRGDIIGYMGSTGLSTGPHLHYEVHIGTEYVDPMNYLSIESANGAVNLDGRNSG